MSAVWRIAGAAVAATASVSVLAHRSAARPFGVAENDLLQEILSNDATTATANLGRLGMCMLPGAVDRGTVQRCLDLRCSRDAQSPAERRAHFRQSTQGRWHRQRFSPDDLATLAALEASWRPVVDMYMGQPTSRTDLQLLYSLPGSEHQFFHQDNSQRSLTVVVPLVDYDVDIGPTQLIAGTHTLSGDVAEDAKLLSRLPAPDEPRQPMTWTPLRGCMPAGWCMMYDSRVLHRGLGNATDAPRPMLVFRYDHPDHPAPGHNIATTALAGWLGSALCAAAELRRITSRASRLPKDLRESMDDR